MGGAVSPDRTVSAALGSTVCAICTWVVCFASAVCFKLCAQIRSFLRGLWCQCLWNVPGTFPQERLDCFVFDFARGLNCAGSTCLVVLFFSFAHCVELAQSMKQIANMIDAEVFFAGEFSYCSCMLLEQFGENRIQSAGNDWILWFWGEYLIFIQLARPQSPAETLYSLFPLGF